MEYKIFIGGVQKKISNESEFSGALLKLLAGKPSAENLLTPSFSFRGPERNYSNRGAEYNQKDFKVILKLTPYYCCTTRF
jgi:hypothetical protein